MNIINDHRPIVDVLRVYERYLQALSRRRGGDGGVH